MLNQPVFSVKIFVDTADVQQIKAAFQNPIVRGVTTNPSLARKAGVKHYRDFIRQVVDLAGEWPASFEVIADEFDEMRRQAEWIAAQGDNVYVKLPITNTRGESTLPLVTALGRQGVKINLTAVFTQEQVQAACLALDLVTPSFLSIFCGRINDAGQDCLPIVQAAVELARPKGIEVLWASAREPYNVVHAQQAGAAIITLFPAFIDKLHLFGRDLEQFSLETVQMFFRDATTAGYSL